MNEIDQIQEALKTDNESPTQLASYLTQLAGWNSYYTEMMKKIQLIKPEAWLFIQNKERFPNTSPDAVFEFTVKERSKPLSDKKTEMVWASTEDGQKETALTYELKRIDILYRSINKRLSAIENDFRMSKSQI
jgi:hypothetical protein